MAAFGTRQNLPTVLLIDDDLVSREVIATLLTLSGYILHTAEDGAAALEMLTTGAFTPGAVLMDSQMPGLSGVPLIAELRLRSKAMVIVISGSVPPGEVAAAADGFLLKPFGADALRALLRKRPRHAAPTPASRKNIASPTKRQKPATAGKKSSSRKWERVRSTKEPVVSTATLAQLREMMPAAKVRQIYLAIVTDLAARLEALDGAIARNDAAEIRRIGHAIKGGCGMAGALQAARLGALLEVAALDPEGNHLDNGSVLIDDLRAAARNLERMLDLELPA